MVGALVVDDEGVVVGRGFHEMAGGPHAEVHALRDAGDRARGATLYCTLEPCTHQGRTGPCAPLLVAAGIRRAVVAVEDPNPLVSGGGIAWLRDHGIEVAVGVCADAAEELNRPFFTRMREGRPFVTMKIALSLDGRVSAARGVRTRLTGDEADRGIHRERAEVDALAVGSGTVLADDPLLTARVAYRYRPLIRVVFDRRLRTGPNARLFSTLAAGPVIIVCTTAGIDAAPDRARALAAAGARLEPIDAGIDDGVDAEPDAARSFLRRSLARLAALDVTSLIVEGGPTLHETFWQAGLVDRVEIFVTPHALGPQGTSWFSLPDGSIARLDHRTETPMGDDVLIEGYVHRSH
jgi:diaminohydroxyphosphoribosylaminopyrimidine deaminase/5-amino-6-(5-phosphoribosylamino)uracil reductase